MKKLSDFCSLYPLSKTLRFELIPQGKTLEFIEKNGVLTQDMHRAESYIKVKEIIDKYHKAFISISLDNLQLDLLDDYYLYYQIPKREESEKKKFEEIQARLRKQIADQFTKNSAFKNLFTKELIKEDLKLFVSTPEDQELISEFDSFTTYFTGFHENRRNMYSSEDKSTAIAYRLIHQNLPRFIDNMSVFEKVWNSPIQEKIIQLNSDTELGPIIGVESTKDMFNLNFFNYTITQLGIDKYNHLIGGYTSDDGRVKIQGLNEHINLHNQNVKREERLPRLKPLYKQILSDRTTASFILDEFTNDNEVLENIEKFYQELSEHVINKNIPGEHSLRDLLRHLPEYNLNLIYLKNDLSLTDISQKLFGDWGIIQKATSMWFDQNYAGKAKVGTEKYDEEQKKFFKNQDSFSIQFLNNCLQLLDNNEYHKNITECFLQANSKGRENEKNETFFETIESNYNTIRDLLNNPYPTERKLSQDEKSIEQIKAFLDSIKALQWFVKPLLGHGNESEKDERFYGEFTSHWNTLDQITPIYNKVRNYMTRKAYSTEKIKLNFDNSTLLDGWDVNKETDNSGVILKKDDLYYLGIMNKKNNKLFKNYHTSDSVACYEKMEYKQLPLPNQNLPRIIFAKSRIKEFNPSSELLEIYKNGTHKKGEKFNIEHCHQLIDFFKASINKNNDWKTFNFNFSETQHYGDLSGFYREVENQGYKISFKNIPADEIDRMVEEGKLYLFQIYNKDFSPFSKGTPNMHTLYWKMLFDSDNLRDVVYKLNGQAEVFYRKSSINEEDKIVHRANEPINNKNEDHNKNKKQSKFDYDIIKDRRYTVDKFQFHVPITINFKSPAINNINTLVNQYLKKSTDFHIIGIDRGERHLLYLTVIDSRGKIIRQSTLNEIINEHQGNHYKTNYHDLLNRKEGDRDEARKNWKTIETIKELKEGYLSQVVHQVTKLMVEYNAILVLEDLNVGFMRSRQKVEKQVYQKFEKMLIDKLNYLVDKNLPPNEIGGTLHAYQLSNKFESFQKMGKQSGFLYYVPAWNTSKMDPVTGFVNLFTTKYENIEKARQFFSKFESIEYNSSKGYFEFNFDYNNFTQKATGSRTQWTVCTNDNRIEPFRNPQINNNWDNRTIELTKAFIDLFEEYKIDYTSNLKQRIELQTEKSFFERIIYLFKMTLQMRNSITGTDTDYLISPVADENGKFYDSRDCKDILPKDADANGAYNIARKGLWIVDQIKQTDDLKKLKLAISNKEWLTFAQS